MKFSNSINVDGKFIQGEISNGKFLLTHITSKNGIAPPLPPNNYFTEKELSELITELQDVKERISKETTDKARQNWKQSL